MQERKIIDFQTHMNILGPNLSNAMVIFIAGRAVEKLLNQSNSQVEKGSFKLLSICHHFTSGMKAITSEMSYKGTDECRQSCGGVGYHVASGLVTGFTDHAVFSTFEGVNVLMLQQSSRYLLKQARKAKSGKKCTNNFSYINNLSQLIESRLSATTTSEIVQLDTLEVILRVRAAFHLQTTYENLQISKETSFVKQNEIFATDIQKMTKYHIIYMMFLLKREAINNHKFDDKNNEKILEMLLQVFALK